MLKRWIWVIATITITLSLFGCGSNSVLETPVTDSATSTTTKTVQNTPSSLETIVPATPMTSPQLGSTVGSPFLPGEVLATLPVYPGATPTTLINPGFGPPSFPLDIPSYNGPKRPGYQSASAQYTVQATEEDISGWYKNQMAAKGYRLSEEELAGSGALSSYNISFFLPSQPLISMQVHVYTSQDISESLVFELLVTYSIPLPKPPKENLPADIESVQIDYAPGTAKEVEKTITDARVIKRLVSMVNGLTVSPDYVTTGGPIPNPGVLPSPQPLFSLTFHSTIQGNITVSYILGAIKMDGYPALVDTHGLFEEAVEQMLGIPGTSN